MKRVVLLIHIEIFGELTRHCVEIEMINNRRNQYESVRPLHNNHNRGNFTRAQNGRPQHGRKPFPKPRPPQNNIAGRLDLNCFFCGGAHLNRDCPCRKPNTCHCCG